MKTLKFLTALLITTMCFNCDTDDDAISNTQPPLPATSINLEFDLTTNQDQMGDFANKAMTVFNGHVWAFGGSDDYVTEGDSTNQLWNSSNGVNWASVNTNSTLSPLGRHGLTLTSFNGKMYLIGGEDNDHNILSDIWETSDGINWTNTLATAPFGQVAGHSTIVFNGNMYVIGINYTTGNTKIWSTTNGSNWTEENSNAFPALKRYKTVVLNNAMYVIGSEKITGVMSNEIWRSTNGSTWTLISQSSSNPLPALRRHTATIYNNKAFVIGGLTTSGTQTNNIYYSEDMETWNLYTDTNPLEAIDSHCSLIYNSELWVFGGSRPGSLGRTGKIWRIMEF
mgnify:CR=1 FL=1